MSRDMTTKRTKLFRERGHRCEMCGYDGYLEVHHILSVEKGGDNKDNNLKIVCEKCHADLHGYKKVKWIDERRKLWGYHA